MKLKKILLFFLISILTFFTSTITFVKASTLEEEIFEFRGGWVATVSNIDIGKQSGSSELSILAYKTQFLNILKVFEDYNMNTMIFQVRPTNDAFYKSKINPWSRYLIGTEGTDPGWDPMAWMIEECHKRDIEFHAWLNPYRASVGVLPVVGDYSDALMNYLNTLDPINFARNNPELLVRGVHDSRTGDARVLLNPAKEAVRDHIYDTIEEIVVNYDVDAIHFDDYFYNGVADEEDASDYQDYKNTGGTLLKGDWRREQVNILIEDIHNLLEAYNLNNNENVEFGISPAGVWAPADNMGCGANGQPGGMTGIQCGSYSSYNQLYADTRKWVREEWIDYILPQNYGDLFGNHPFITSWWANETKDVDVKLYIGLAPYQYNQANVTWDVRELDDQMDYGDGFEEVDGYCMYSISSLRSPASASMSKAMVILKERWKTPAFNLIKNEKTVLEYKQPLVTSSRNTNHVMLSFEPNDSSYGYIVYRINANETFDVINTPIYDIINNKDTAFTIRYDADNTINYKFYVQTVYMDKSISSSTKEIVTGIYDYNEAPQIKNVKIESPLLVFKEKSWVTISGEVDDANHDDLIVTIKLVDKVYKKEETINVTNGKFEKAIYLPPISFNRAYFMVTVTDGLETNSQRTLSFYAPAEWYTKIEIHLKTYEIITNDTINSIYK